MEGRIKLHNKFLEWEWYDDINTKILFLHLLLKANWKDKNWRWKNIKRWQLITWRYKLSQETWLSEYQVRSSLDKLKSTKEIASKPTNEHSLITVLEYDKYQSDIKKTTSQSTDEPPLLKNIYIENKKDIEEILDIQYIQNNKNAIKCVRIMIELWYNIEKKADNIYKLIQWMKNKAKLYEHLLPWWEIDWMSMLTCFNKWKDWVEWKWIKVKWHKNWVSKFLDTNRKPKWIYKK